MIYVGHVTCRRVYMHVHRTYLDIILQYRPKEFIRAATQCQSVIFCRVSATQKRELVTHAKSLLHTRILAVGDGANDVGMIRESHCGVAVYGREGSQAVAASDFTVDRFECLRRLLLVHGAWCFTRMSELILYTFMHNCVYVMILFYHQFINGYSGAVSIHSFCKYSSSEIQLHESLLKS
jgi:P-type E1-E2 ATPase